MPVIATGLMAMTGGSRIGPIVWFGIVCIAGATAILTARETKDDVLICAIVLSIHPDWAARNCMKIGTDTLYMETVMELGPFLGAKTDAGL